MRWILLCALFCLIPVFLKSEINESLNSMVSIARKDIVSLWGVFDLLHACRIAPEARKDFEKGCIDCAQELLNMVVFLCNQKELCGKDIDVLYRYFSAMRSSFVSACRGVFLGEEVLLRHFFAAINELFCALRVCPDRVVQKEHESEHPSRLCALAAAVDPKA